MAGRQVETDKKRFKWTPSLDTLLVSCMVELYSTGTHTHETSGFKTGYRTELEKLLKVKLPNSRIKAEPHIDSRIKTLKKEWSIVYDMIYGKSTSGFGWDPSSKLVTAEDAVWEAYLASRPDAEPFKTRTFPYFEEFCTIYGKDRATGKNAQDAGAILEDLEKENDDHEVETSAENSVAAEDSVAQDSHEQTSNRDDVSSSSRKRKRKSSNQEDAPTAKCILDAAKLLGDNIREVGKELSKSIGFEMQVKEQSMLLDAALGEVEGLAECDREIALSKIPDYPSQMVVFFSLPPSRRLGWLRRFLMDH